MKSRLPLNISLLSNEKSRLLGLLPVQSMSIYNLEGDFHEQGLYSNIIFGKPGEPSRLNRHSYIDMKLEIMHPKVFTEVCRFKGLYKGIMMGQGYAIWNPKDKDFEKSDIVSGRTGYSFFMEHFMELDIKRNSSRLRDIRANLLMKYRDKCMYRYLVVLPAGLRDVEVDDSGRPSENPINAFYKKVIRYSNTITPEASNKHINNLDVPRWGLQNAFNEIFEYIVGILSGKKGFLLDKLASREIHNSTRNIITAMDPAADVVGDYNAIDVNDTIFGLHQYLKGTNELSIFNIKNGPLYPIYNGLPNDLFVIDKQTLKRKHVIPTDYTLEKWGTEAGLEKVISDFGKLESRHDPIKIAYKNESGKVDTGYLALIYRDKETFKVFYSIEDLPEGFNKDNVKPISYIELLYLSVYENALKSKVSVTRYPITGTGSIYPSNVVLKTTTIGEQLMPMNDLWVKDDTKPVATNMPLLTIPDFDSMSVHPNREEGLGSDHDGDKVSAIFLVTDEALEYVNKYQNSATAYMDPTGNLLYGINSKMVISSMVLFNFTRGLE